MPYLVFISHSSHDRWAARQLGKELAAAGAECFLDAGGIEAGDEFDRRLKQALHDAAELVVLVTPEALKRPYVWVEIGIAWMLGMRIVGLLHGMSMRDLIDYDGAPSFLISTQMCDINELDKYLDELRRRIDDD
jgi:hypothetical protein